MTQAPASIEKWGVFELELEGPSEGNPFTEVELSARFQFRNRVLYPDGFYDGDGVYRVRFMPDAEGEWSFVTESNVAALDGKSGSFTVTPPAEGNHGPVQVKERFHFAYADGTPYRQVGTTCYAWAHQGDAMEEQTLKTLADAPFNKMRMCVFPKDYTYSQNEPELYAFPRSAEGENDLTRFNPEFFRHFERRVEQLGELGIEADLILFHPYDRWDYSKMPAEADDRYLRYVIARLAAYRNVWWSLANEYDIMKSKTMEDWHRFVRIVMERDPYRHMTGIHNCHWSNAYDHGRAGITHVSVQSSELGQCAKWRQQFGKPLVVDECCYEGNIPEPWGNISARELVHRFWVGTVNGAYVGHGETYLHDEDILWWSKGGVLRGESPARLAFLREILEAVPAPGLTPGWGEDWRAGGQVASVGSDFALFYFGEHQPARWTLKLPEGDYGIEIIDTWEMTITPVEGTHQGETVIALPGKPGMALRVRKQVR